MNRSQDIGPEVSSPASTSSTLAGLWRLAGSAPQDTVRQLIVVTQPEHLRRVEAALNELEVDLCPRQCVVVVGEHSSFGTQVSLVEVPLVEVSLVQVSLVSIGGQYAERLQLSCRPDELRHVCGSLSKPGVATQLWWARDHAPPTDLLRVLARHCVQIILDTLSEHPTLVACPLADLSWARTEPWRKLIGPQLDELNTQGMPLEGAVLRYSQGDARPARLFAAWLAERLDWESAAQVRLAEVQSPRSAGDLDAVELLGPGSYGLWEADDEAAGHGVQVRLTVGGCCHSGHAALPDLRLVDGLSSLLRHPRDGTSQMLHFARTLEARS
jgi:Glucose-6-phosphate dehydrogenase subunit